MNWEQVEVLLNVIHAASTAGPKYAKIASAADDELWAMTNKHQPQAKFPVVSANDPSVVDGETIFTGDKPNRRI